ncbi:Predicted ATPase with chaperone activity [Maledivibacter halophilus]|uniref:Predicted ATPase with chaperone activity n=2 Tax=Maledivibacter halophilus TaxID=36842 RepID=A0A1T5MR64_9FIRM|nr:Predicted ATPase with chaperone activity [Maledivibacter halophilus]
MHIEVFPVEYKELAGKTINRSSEEIKRNVDKARKVQIRRYANETARYNSQLTPKLTKKYCKLGKSESQLLEKAFKKLRLSARSYNKIIKLSRTIADLDNSEDIELRHLSEAIQYRSLDKNFWNV